MNAIKNEKYIMRRFNPFQVIVSGVIIGLSFSAFAQAAPKTKFKYIQTALPTQQKEAFTQMPSAQQQKVKNIIDQNATQPQTAAPAQVMDFINEDEIPKMVVTELRESTITNTTTGLSQTVTLKLQNNIVVAIMDKDGWEKTSQNGKTIVSAENGAAYTFTRGKLRHRTKKFLRKRRISYKKCMKSRSCKKSYARVAKRLKKVKYIPTRLRAKHCMKKKSCRKAVQRIISRFRTKHCYIPTRGRKVCKVK